MWGGAEKKARVLSTSRPHTRLATLVPPLLVQGRSIEAVASSACLTLPHRLQCRAASLAVAAAAAFAAYVAAAAAVAVAVTCATAAASLALTAATAWCGWRRNGARVHLCQSGCV